MEVLIHYGDLSLKGKNRSDFVNVLARNIERAAGGRCSARRNLMIMRGGDAVKLKTVFGIAWYAPCVNCPKNMADIIELVLREIGARISRGGGDAKTFAVFTKRSDKRFPVKSSEISSAVGSEVCARFGMKVNISAPDLPVYIEITDSVAYVHFEKNPGPGGLPVGASAPLLCLLSGGIDSPVAAICAMKRGCEVDFLHFHVFPDSSLVRETKMPELVDSIARYNAGSRMFLASYKFFQRKALGVFPARGIFRGYELVLFRRFMLRVAQSLAASRGYKGVVTGDCIGQVASQTVENLAASRGGLDCLVVSPLLGWDKKDIVEKARRSGTYEHSIKPYNECCSIVSPFPRTKCCVETVRRLEDLVSIDEVVEETMGGIELFNPNSEKGGINETG